MKAIMIGYWVILVGLVLDVVGTIWDAIGDLTGEEALGGATDSRKTKVYRDSHSNPRSGLGVTDGVETPRMKAGFLCLLRLSVSEKASHRKLNFGEVF